jgi:hypothetical protein
VETAALVVPRIPAALVALVVPVVQLAPQAISLCRLILSFWDSETLLARTAATAEVAAMAALVAQVPSAQVAEAATPG